MSYSNENLSQVVAIMEKYRGDDKGEVGATLVVVGLSAERAAKERPDPRRRDFHVRLSDTAGIHPPIG